MSKIKVMAILLSSVLLVACISACASESSNSSSASSGVASESDIAASASSDDASKPGSAASASSDDASTSSDDASESDSAVSASSGGVSAFDGPSASAQIDYMGSTILDDLDGPPISVTDTLMGKWSCVYLFYGHKEGGRYVFDGRAEGDGVLKVKRTSYKFKFVYPNGHVKLSSKGTITTGVQASFVGNTTIPGYPIAMFTIVSNNEVKFELYDKDFNKSIRANAYLVRK